MAGWADLRSGGGTYGSASRQQCRASPLARERGCAVTGAAVRKRNEWGEGVDVLLGLGVFTTLHRGVKVISTFAIHSDTRSQ